MPALKSCFFVFNDVEEYSDDFDFLDNSNEYNWVAADEDDTADAAVVSGSYIGRGIHNGNVVVGRVDMNTNELVGSHNGVILALSSYEILVNTHETKGKQN